MSAVAAGAVAGVAAAKAAGAAGAGTALAKGAAIATLASTAAALAPSPSAIRYRRDVKKRIKSAEAARRRGEFGLTKEQRRDRVAEQMQAGRAQIEQQKAQIARIQDPVERQRAMTALQQAELGLQAQAESDVRRMDIELGQQELAALMQERYQTQAMQQAERQQRRKSLAAAAPALGQAAQTIAPEIQKGMASGLEKGIAGGEKAFGAPSKPTTPAPVAKTAAPAAPKPFTKERLAQLSLEDDEYFKNLQEGPLG